MNKRAGWFNREEYDNSVVNPKCSENQSAQHKASTGNRGAKIQKKEVQDRFK